LEARIRIRIEMKGTDPDPHHSDKHDPDPHQSERQDPQHCLQVPRSIYFSAAFVPHTVPYLASGPPAAYSTVVVCVCNGIL
jgi:hypothetical protein